MSQTQPPAAPAPVIQPLTFERHGTSGWRRFSDYGFARGAALAPLAAAEVVTAMMSMPLALVPQNGGWQLVAMLGIGPGTNLFVGPDGRWIGDYVPAALRSYPFRIGRVAENDQAILCIDETAQLPLGAGVEPFFAGEKALSPAVSSIWSFLLEIAKGEAQLTRACGLLAEAGIVEPWPITVGTGDQARTVEGLHRLSEAKLAALSDEQLGQLRRAGVLSLAYAQIFSGEHLKKLGELAALQARHAEALVEAARRQSAAPAPAVQPAGAGFAFGESINVDWSKFGG
ncbi:SapC family protein [Antarcticirhabdus aurantiaca]|uniref:SapC family protein n=1 Tax=Antarcticirhabdus aurantiaca TaxID=2606717 RepID=A0ACD4NPW9_9HYPH|nr:SapC family protein [Antarcticirhabdus aurantiaca]WAJ28700.1 SapC family protein [Jeongeuplla avenae]